ncbi:16S rRNA (uracil(1498)-N(3))-methyltransferase [Constantimarinum furrinae]|uniref:Ribosomal RNA small subunit methyltransferase E n=1 Tax=Constantimarinum furrinae TaxID=2562285 RepID=A0A7G8PWU8_9FLAO|nr:16S rRNA (uracil(1498)-N(3))-methyltransferase [Constantimarinum furrinae]QNJ98814.1 Ribosomal RNA small subunit methyltransferase E [Constantimarinum furrinae]
MNLFYHPGISETSKEVMFSKDESRHISKVLRKNAGDLVHLTNGKGWFFDARLESTNPKQCLATITAAKEEPPLKYSLHLAVAPTKLNDRYEWFLEKATEIGITEITPVICDHSERKVIKPERYEKILQSAMKQSLKSHLPQLNNAVSLRSFLESEKTSGATKYIAHCEDSQKKSLKAVLQQETEYTILIGPEGDFSSEEIQQAIANGFIPVSLGESRLRTETAAIVACHSVAYVNE